MTRKQKKMLYRIIISIALLIPLNLLPLTGWLRFALFMGVYAFIGYDILRKAFLGIVNGQVFDECFLMAVATLGAIGLALYDRSGDYNEAVFVMLFYQIGELFQSIAVGKSRKSISALMDIRPDHANIERDGHLVQVSPEEVEPGTVIVVQPGEKIPIDGVVEVGISSLNTVALTGESLPRDVEPGTEVLSGCVNMSGVLKVRTTKAFGESAVTRILELVENASSKKSRSEQFISRFARVYTPAVCCTALALAVLPPLARLLLGLDAAFGSWAYRALTFLVVSCPCALVISIPLTFFAGIGGASKEGILVKGSVCLEGLSKVRTMVFDKTGTLTRGVFEVTEVRSAGLPREELLSLAAHIECASCHPIGRSIQKAFGGEIDRSRVTEIEELGGRGIRAKVDGIPAAAGNRALMEELGVPCEDVSTPGTVVHIASNGAYAGCILISDVIKDHSEAAIAAMKKAGVTRTVMLTGDRAAAAKLTAEALGIDEYRAELLPQEKVARVEELLSEKAPGSNLAFVGDGINDAPVLSRSDLGIAMGGAGSEAAIEAADVVLMDDDPLKIAKAVMISRKCMAIVRQNIIFALVIKFGCLLLSALGMAGMWAAIFADVGVMVLAVLNAIRALRVKNL